MALGLGQGWIDSFRQIQRDIGRSINGLTEGISTGGLTVSAAGAGVAQPAPVNITIHATLSRDMDMRRLARIVLQEAQKAR